MNKNGLVSVVTATYNMANYLGETLTSILAQDYPDLEIIVVDDGSTDHTADVLARYGDDPRVRAVYQENAGQTVAKNRGLKEARGQFIAFCDADDTWSSDKLSRQLPRFSEGSHIGVVFSEVHYMDKDGKPLDIEPMKKVGGKITGPLLIDNFIPFPTAVVRADVAREMGGFDEKLTMSIDYDLWLRISTRYEFAFVDSPLAHYRVWDGQMSHKLGERLENFLFLLERFFEENPQAATRAEKEKAWAHFFVTRGYWHVRQGRKREAWGDYRLALGHRFNDRRLWRHMASLALGRG